jgi:hypothetical protein
MKRLFIGVFQVCSNKSPGVKTGPAPGAFIQVSDLRAIMALLFGLMANKHKLGHMTSKQFRLFGFYGTSTHNWPYRATGKIIWTNSGCKRDFIITWHKCSPLWGGVSRTRFRFLRSRSHIEVKVQIKIWRCVYGPFSHHLLRDCNINGHYQDYGCETYNLGQYIQGQGL